MKKNLPTGNTIISTANDDCNPLINFITIDQEFLNNADDTLANANEDITSYPLTK